MDLATCSLLVLTLACAQFIHVTTQFAQIMTELHKKLAKFMHIWVRKNQVVQSVLKVIIIRYSVERRPIDSSVVMQLIFIAFILPMNNNYFLCSAKLTVDFGGNWVILTVRNLP